MLSTPNKYSIVLTAQMQLSLETIQDLQSKYMADKKKL